MRKRINNKVNIQHEINSIERKIQVKNELIYITSRLNKESFKEAKNTIKWECIKSEVKRQINKI
jgi:hypothetical protein